MLTAVSSHYSRLETTDTARTCQTIVRVASYPAQANKGENPYICLYQNAIEKFGIITVSDFQPTRNWVRANLEMFDVVHLHWGIEWLWRYRGRWPWQQFHGILGLARLLQMLRRHGKKLIWTIHNLHHHEGITPVDWLGYQLLARYADLCICHDDSAREEFLRWRWISPHRVMVMPFGNYDGVYPQARPRWETEERLGILPGRKVLLACGLIRRYKGLDTALAALPELGSEYHLTVAGRPLDHALVNRIRQASARYSITLLDRTVSSQELADLYELADCALFPYESITGSSAILTAASLGRGVIASDLPFFRNLLAVEPAAGELFNAGHPGSLAAAVRRYFARDIRTRHQAARRLADRYPWMTVVRPIVSEILRWNISSVKNQINQL
jgi:beta-1,4-mannosyltransferase